MTHGGNLATGCVCPWCALCLPAGSAAIAPGWVLERGQRVHESGRQKASPAGRWLPDFSVATMTSTRKLGRKYSKAIPGAILHHALKNESISGIEILTIHLHCPNHIVSTEAKQVEHYEVDVTGSDFP